MNATPVRHNSALRTILVLVFAILPGSDFLLNHAAEPSPSEPQPRTDVAAASTAYHIASGVLSNAVVPQLASDRPAVQILVNGTSCVASSLLAPQAGWTGAELSVLPDGLATELTALPGFWVHTTKLHDPLPKKVSAE